jgi:serine/threonine protein kinase
VGPWRVVDWVGQGVHGAVYRAVRIGQERLPPVALKLALLPDHPRFERERELLSRTLHPHIPRLVDSGYWVSPSGARHPFVAMEWVDGVPLYDWARMFRPSAAQQLRLLAQVALTLQYLHAQHALHRDLKGGNLLVRRSDSRLFVTDFGSGIYPDAASLTPQQLPPGTPAYRSPEAWLFSQRFRGTSERYRAGPADDVFALGVTACVLATGTYPEMGELRKDEQGRWSLDSLLLPRALFSAQVAPPLRELILRMLSIRPGERGTAAELAQALEWAADSLTPPCPLPSASRAEPATVLCAEAASSPRAPVHSRSPWLVLAVATGALATWAVGMTWAAFLQPHEEAPRVSQAAHPADRKETPEAGPVRLGEAAASTTTPSRAQPSASEFPAADSPPDPFEGQAQPDKKGRCPHPQQVILNGSCWGRMDVSREKCEAGGGQMYLGTCYVPVLPPGTKRPNTSSPGRPP